MRLFKDKLFRNVFISVILLVLLGAAYYAVMKMPDSDSEISKSDSAPEISSDITAFSADIKDIDELYVNNADGEYTIISETVKEGDEETTVYKIKNSSVEYSSSLLRSQCYGFINISASKELETENEAYGLSSPSATAQIRLKDGSVTDIAIGNKVIGGSGYFAKINEKIYNVSEYFGNSVLKGADSFRDKSIASFDMTAMTKFNISKNDETIKVRPIHENEESKFSKTTAFIMTEPKYVSVSADYLSKLSEQIKSISVKEFISDNTADFELYGLKAPVLTFEFADAETDITVHFGNKTKDGDVYANVDGKSTVFTADSALFDVLSQVTAEALADKLCNLVYIDDIKSVTVENGGKKYKLSVKGEDDNQKYYLNGKTANEEAFKKAYQAIIGITSNGFAENDVSGDAEYTVTYKYKDGTTQKAKYINYDERNYVLDFGGNREFTVLKKKLADMMTSIETFAEDPGKKPAE